MNNKKTAGKIIFWVLLVLLLALCLGFVAKLTDGFREDFATFYVTVDGKDVISSGSGFCVTKDTPLTAEVHYIFDDGTAADAGYTIQVVPNAIQGKDFDFTADGQAYSFQAETDLTDGFTIEKTEDSFTVVPKGDTLTEILRFVHAGKTVEDCNDALYADMFTLIVTPNNGEAAVKLHFSLPSEVEGLKLDKEVVIF